MKGVAATHRHVYQAPIIDLQCNWLIPEIAIKILQHLYYRDVTSFSCSCKQAYSIIYQEDFWPKLADAIFSSNEAPEKLNPRKKFKIYSNLFQNRNCEKSIEVKDCLSMGNRIVWQNRLVFLHQTERLAALGTMLRLEMIDLKELKMVEDHSIEDYFYEMTACQDQLVFGLADGRLGVTSISNILNIDKFYHHFRKFERLACNPESKIVAAADEKGTILVWKVKDEPAPSQIFSISVNVINDLSVGHDVIVARDEQYVFSLYHTSEKLISKKLVLPDVSHAAVYQDQLVTSHNEIISNENTAPVVKIWDAKTIELKETINLAQLSWIVNPLHDTDFWRGCDWTEPCMEGVFVSQVRRKVNRPCIVVWNLKTKKGSGLNDVDPGVVKNDFLIHKGQFIITKYCYPNIIKLFDFSHEL